MNDRQQVEKIVAGAVYRAILESIAASLVLLTFSCILSHISTGTIQYYGCILSLATVGFILGVLWSFILCYRFFRSHVTSGPSFWREAFILHARLLRFLPFWYLIPACCGVMLFISPQGDAQYLSYVTQLVIVLWLAGGIVWLNRFSAYGADDYAREILLSDKTH